MIYDHSDFVVYVHKKMRVCPLSQVFNIFKNVSLIYKICLIYLEICVTFIKMRRKTSSDIFVLVKNMFKTKSMDLFQELKETAIPSS